MEAAAARSSTRGLSEFLVDHELHGQGFDVSHPDGLGNGRIEITCRGCGHSYSYAPGRVRVEREIELEPIRSASPTASPSPSPAPAAPAATVRTAPEPTPAPKPAGKKKAKTKTKAPDGGRSLEDRALVGALVVFAIAAFAFAAYRITEDRSGDSGSGDVASTATSPASASAVKRVNGAGYSIVVPSSWSRTTVEGKTALASPTGNASVEIFESTNPNLDRSAFAASAASYLSSTPPGGAVSKPGPAGAAGKPGFSLVDSGPGGTQKAIGVLSGPNRLLVVGTTSAKATPTEATAVSSSLATLSVR